MSDEVVEPTRETIVAMRLAMERSESNGV